MHPAADFPVTRTLVASLLKAQHPDLASLPLKRLGTGWDNTTYLLGTRLAVRLPRRAAAAPLISRERAALATLAPRLPLPVPVHVRAGAPDTVTGYPFPWAVATYVPGEPATAHAPLRARDARGVARFLAALHGAPGAAAAPGNVARDCGVRGLAPRARDALRKLPGSLPDPGLVAAAERAWARVEGVSEWPGDGVWVHGDLHAGNVVVDEGGLAGVIDFGDVCAGDPAVDYGAAWTMFDAAGVRALREEVGCDEDTWTRATVWALYYSMMYVMGSGGRRDLVDIGVRVLRCVADDHGR